MGGLSKFFFLFLLIVNIVLSENLRFSPTYYHFGLITLDTTSSYTFEVKNISPYQVHICNVELKAEGFPGVVFSLRENSCSGYTLSPEETCTVQVSFTPREKKVYSATLLFLYDDNGNELVCDILKRGEILLEGIGTSLRVVRIEPEPVISGSYFHFPEITYGERSSMTFRICNAGGENIILSSEAIKIENSTTGAFGISYNTCNNAVLVYAPDNEACTTNYCEFEIVFNPSSDVNFYEWLNAVIRIKDLNAGPNSTPSGYSIYISARTRFPEGEILNAPVGGQVHRNFTVNFTCPDNGNDTPGETISLNNVSVSISGAYFRLGEVICPSTCIEGLNVNCTVSVVFNPLAPGIYEGLINIVFPNGEVVNRTVIGIAGSITGRYIITKPEEIVYTKTLPLNLYEQTVEIKNVSGGQIPFDVYVYGPGFGISRVVCACNKGYFYNSQFCIPITDETARPTTGRPYTILPGETCTVYVYFFPPLGKALPEYKGELIISTPIDTYTVHLNALSESQIEAPIPIDPPLVDLGGGGGCTSAPLSMAIVPPLIIYVVRLLFRIKRW